MWRLYWQNQLFKILFLGMLFGASSAIAQFSNPLGLIKNLEDLAELRKEKAKALFEQINKNPKTLEDLDKVKDIKIENDYLLSLFFYSPLHYVEMATTNECSLYALLDNKLINAHEIHSAPTIPVRLILDENKSESALISDQEFFDFIQKNKCPALKDIKALFGPRSLKKTFKSLALTVPQNETECEQIINSWKTNPYTPYICAMSEKIQKMTNAKQVLKDKAQLTRREKEVISEYIQQGQLVVKELSSFEQQYIQNLCVNFSRPEKFCDKYLIKNFWSQVLNAQAPIFHLKYRCQQILKKDQLSKRDYLACAENLNSHPEFCREFADDQFPSLFPRQNCDQIAQALSHSRLISPYRDCPGRVGNGAIVNTFRLAKHFKNEAVKSDPAYCAASQIDYYAQLNLKADNEEAWDLKLCYQDIVKEQEVCHPTLLTHFPGSEYSLQETLAKILGRIKSNFADSRCHFVEKSQYNPALLRYKQGCFALYQHTQCEANECPLEIIFDNRPVTQITIKGKLIQDYSTQSYTRGQRSLLATLQKAEIFKTKEIKNLTEFKVFFKQHKNALAHGTGCAEDILPGFFQTNRFGVCQPLHFIVDGFFDVKYKTYLVVRTSVDEVLYPRLIPWPYLYNGIKSFQEIHPLRSWTFYGAY